MGPKMVRGPSSSSITNTTSSSITSPRQPLQYSRDITQFGGRAAPQGQIIKPCFGDENDVSLRHRFVLGWQKEESISLNGLANSDGYQLFIQNLTAQRREK